MIDKDIRDKEYKEISKYFDHNAAKIIEESVYNFSVEYAENNGTPFLLENIYVSKAEELIEVFKKNLQFIIKNIKNKTIDLSNIAFMSMEELNPNEYKDIFKKKMMEEMKKDNTSDIVECKKCKKSKVKITELQLRSGDEPADTFATCQECGHVFML